VTTLYRTAGQAGSISLTTRNSAGQLVTPVSVPVAQWYTDSGRTAGAVALTVTGSGSSYTATWTAGQAPTVPSSRFLKFTVEVSAGVFDTDANDDVQFVDATVDVDALPVTAAELRAHLQIPNSEQDDALLAYAAAYVPVIEEMIGSPIVARTVTDEIHVSGGVGLLHYTRPISLVSVTDGYGTAVTGGVLDRRIGAVRFPDGWGWSYPDPLRPVTVTYTAGFAEVPAAVKQALLVMVQINYSREQQGYMPGYGDTNEQPISGPTLAHVRTLLMPYLRAPAVA
jgi:hypothetical protein